MTTFSELDLIAIRHLILQTANPTDDQLLSIVKGDVNKMRGLVRRYLPMLIDHSVPIDKLVSLFNAPPRPPVPIVKRPNVIPCPIITAPVMTLPPKYRSKGLPKAPPPATSPHVMWIPVLPRYEQPTGVSARRNRTQPQIGSLAAIVYPSLGPAHVCRVIGMKFINGLEYFLVVFFQTSNSPCYVSGEYLFQLDTQKGLPLEDDEEFRRQMATEDVTVDWLLEKIFSSAQNLVMSSSDVLLPSSELSRANYKPNPQQVQQIMFQCVSSAALLVLCRVCSEWTIPEEKVKKMVTAILKANQPKYVSTQKILDNVESCLLNILSAK